MRIDKYLKVARIIKRRQIAKEICDASRVYVNDKLAKSSSKIKEEDLIQIEFGNKILTIQVKRILNSTKKEDAIKMYEIIKEIRKDN